MNPNTARLAAVVALASGISCGTALADTMTGSLVFVGDATNWYDPANSNPTFQPPGSSNTSSPTVTLVGGTTATFGYQDVLDTDTAAFTAGQLDIKIVLGPADPFFGQGSLGWTQTFMASAPGFFTGWKLSSSDFPATFTSSLDSTNTTLTVTWSGTDTGGATFDAVFTSSPTSPVPGPIVGAGLPGLALAFGGILAWRRRKREMA
jgi:hypothetical protein